jgi:hypothetical protein
MHIILKGWLIGSRLGIPVEQIIFISFLLANNIFYTVIGEKMIYNGITDHNLCKKIF